MKIVYTTISLKLKFVLTISNSSRINLRDLIWETVIVNQTSTDADDECLNNSPRTAVDQFIGGPKNSLLPDHTVYIVTFPITIVKVYVS